MKNMDHKTNVSTILVVEDEALIRRMVVRLLRERGYQVLEASSGKEAFEVCSDPRNTIDVMVTDFVMPGMNGRQLCSLLLSVRPHLKTIFMSAFPETAVLARGLLKAEDVFVEKQAFSTDLIPKVEAFLSLPS